MDDNSEMTPTPEDAPPTAPEAPLVVPEAEPEAEAEPVVGEPAEEPLEQGAMEDAAEEANVEEALVEAVEETILEQAAEEAVVEAIEDGTVEAAVEGAVTEAAEAALADDGVIDEAEAEAIEVVAEVAAAEAVLEAAEEAVMAAAVEIVAAEEAVAAEEPPPVIEMEGGRDPFKGPGEWYVVHTYAGYENKVKTNLQSRIHTMQMEEKIFDVHIPMEDVMEIKGGKKQVVQKKVFPGYLLVKMIYDNDSWYVVRNTPGVTGFVSAGTGTKPTPLSKREIEKILAIKKEEVKPTFRLGFEEGDVVRIISGPFADFNGTINEINVDQSKLKVLVNIFDRETPVELGFDQVAKV